MIAKLRIKDIRTSVVFFMCLNLIYTKQKIYYEAWSKIRGTHGNLMQVSLNLPLRNASPDPSILPMESTGAEDVADCYMPAFQENVGEHQQARQEGNFASKEQKVIFENQKESSNNYI